MKIQKVCKTLLQLQDLRTDSKGKVGKILPNLHIELDRGFCSRPELKAYMLR